MKLNRLFDIDSNQDIDVLVLDSRDKVKNGLFFCLEGLTVDGHAYVNKAIENGCVAIVHHHELDNYDDSIVYIKVQDTMDELHRVTNIFFDNPSSKMKIHTITGTNGKSSVMKTLRNILVAMGHKAGYIGTISVEYNDHKFSPSLTTPDIVELQGILKDMVDEGITEVCIEVSSQGLALRRVDAIQFHDASFTNLTHDHLDYHKNMEDYFQAKKVLFDRMGTESFTIINADDAYGQRLIKENYPNLKTYAIDNAADYKANNIKLGINNTEFTLEHQGKSYFVDTNLLAHFNVYNVLNVIAILHEDGHAIEDIIPYLKDVEHVDGRLTKVEEGQDFKVFVDFGHAPDSMANVFEYVRSITPKDNKMICVFGAAGARDTLKRPKMGAVSTSMCDHVIITEHDNRNEEVVDITKDIVSGVVSDNWEFVPIRIEAIRKALSMAKPGDSVVLNGKGEERFIYREFGKEDWMGDEVCAARILRGEL